MRRLSFLAVLMLLVIMACRKKDDPATTNNPTNVPTGNTDTIPRLTIKFQNVMNGEALQLKSVYYKNAHGDSFMVNNYEYYISNITLTDTGNNKFSEPESYHLVRQDFDTTREFTINNITPGNYSSISFVIGVDSARNVSGAQTGQLDPANGMFWDWNTGYIMARVEGFSPQISSYPGNLAYHIGGFTGIYNALRTVKLNFSSPVHIASGSKPVIIIRSELAEWFKTPETIDITKLSLINSVNANSSIIAQNYSDMFSVYSVEYK